MMRVLNLLMLAIVIGAPLLISSCILPQFKFAPITKAEHLSYLKEGKVLVVGRIVLNPPMKKHEQKLDSTLSRTIDIMDNLKDTPYYGKDAIERNAGWFFADEKSPVFKDFKDVMGSEQFVNSIYVTFGKTFHVIAANRPFFISTGVVYLQHWTTSQYISPRRSRDIIHVQKAYFPVGVKVEIQPGDKAVYIGTIKYTRNINFEIYKAEILDEFSRENAAFRKKFGTKYKLKKRIAKILKGSKLKRK